MLDRRTFLRLSLAGLASAAVPDAFAAAQKRSPNSAAPTPSRSASHRPLGVQLYTLRQDLDRNLPALLKSLSKIGYKEVELFGPLYNRPAAELRKMLADDGLTAPSGHFEYDSLESKLDY